MKKIRTLVSDLALSLLAAFAAGSVAFAEENPVDGAIVMKDRQALQADRKEFQATRQKLREQRRKLHEDRQKLRKDRREHRTHRPDAKAE